MKSEDIMTPYGGGNALLDHLPADLQGELKPHLIVYEEQESAICLARDESIEAVYFPIDAIYSIVVEVAGGNAYEVDLVGRDGMVCAEIALGAQLAARTVICQSAGRVARLTRERFSVSVARSREFREAVRESARRQWYVGQQTVACNYAHSVEERAARWILMTQDAVGRSHFRIRAEFASMMLGMPAKTVVKPILELEQRGCVRYDNEQITILSREALRAIACECYDRQHLAPFVTTRGLSAEL
jgi:CRP-like cAMP-binding protein